MISRPLQLPSIPQRRKGREEKVGPRETEMMGNGKREPKGKLPNERKQSGTNGIGVVEKGQEHSNGRKEMRKDAQKPQKAMIERRKVRKEADKNDLEVPDKTENSVQATRNTEKGSDLDDTEDLIENGTTNDSSGGEKKRERRRKSPAVTSINEKETKPWGRRRSSLGSTPLVPSSSLQSLPHPSRGNGPATPSFGSYTLPRRAKKAGSEPPPVIRPYLPHRTSTPRIQTSTDEFASKRTLSPTLSAPTPRTSSFCPSCPPRTYSTLPRTFNSLPRRANKASYTFYSHSISTTISASPTASSNNIFIPRKVFSVTDESKGSRQKLLSGFFPLRGYPSPPHQKDHIIDQKGQKMYENKK